MDININAHFWTARAFVPAMLKRNHGFVITIASAAGLIGVAGLNEYCASKFAAFGFAESLRFELQKGGYTGVKSLAVCPFYINTGMFDGVKARYGHFSLSFLANFPRGGRCGYSSPTTWSTRLSTRRRQTPRCSCCRATLRSCPLDARSSRRASLTRSATRRGSTRAWTTLREGRKVVSQC